MTNDNLNGPPPEQEMEIAAAIRDLLRQHDARTNQKITDNREALTLQMNAQQDVLDQLVARKSHQYHYQLNLQLTLQCRFAPEKVTLPDKVLESLF